MRSFAAGIGRFLQDGRETFIGRGRARNHDAWLGLLVNRKKP